MSSKVKILTPKQLDERYFNLADTKMARLTQEALKKGYSIALINKNGLSHSEDLSCDVQVALEMSVPKSSVISVWCYTDMSELDKDQIYVAFKELKNQACAHSSNRNSCRITA